LIALRAFALVALLVLCGCERTMRDMYDQPRYKPLAASLLWPDGRSSRPAVEGTVARSERDAPPAGVVPTAQSLARGRDRFDIFCAPCHGVVGDGDGMIVRRGFPRPQSFHSDALRATTDAHLYSVITDGYGAMYPYATRVAPADRLAIIGYVRALQLSQHAPFAALPEAERARLTAAVEKR
jgi:mono/diheme cytochrome c family protein